MEHTLILLLGAASLKGSPLKGLLKPSAKPVYALHSYPLRPQSKVEQKIEQKVEQKIEQQVVQQEEELPVVQQQELEPAKKPMKVGIIKWEQHIETPKNKPSYKPRKSILKPQVQQIEQQLVQQEEEPVQQQLLEQLPLEQKVLKSTPLVSQKPLKPLLPARSYPPKQQSKPVRTEQQTYQNVRQVPTTFNADAGWD